MVTDRKRAAFVALVTKILLQMGGQLTLANNVKKYLALQLSRMAKKIADRTSDTVAEKSLLEHGDINAVLHEFLTGDALKAALSNTTRNVLQYNTGLLKFKPKEPAATSLGKKGKKGLKGKKGKKELKGKKGKKVEKGKGLPLPSEAFTPGLRKLITEIENVDAPKKIDDGCKQILDVISSIGVYIASRVGEDLRRQNIREMDFTHVENTISNIFPPELLQLSKYTGMLRVEFYEKGVLEYKKHIPQLETKKRKALRRTPKRRSEPPRKKMRKTAGTRKVPRKVTPKTKKSSRKTKSKSRVSKARKRSATSKVKSLKVAKKSRKRRLKSKSKTPRREKGIRKTIKAKGKNIFKPHVVKTITGVFCANIDHAAATRINDFLLDVCHSLIVECSNSKINKENPLSEGTIKTAVSKILPKTMHQHAFAAAHKAFMTRESNLRSIPSLEVTEDIPEVKYKEPFEEDYYDDELDSGASAETIAITEPYQDEDIHIEGDTSEELEI